MRLTRIQFHRFSRIASLLKQNRYPNPKSLVEEFHKIHIEDEKPITCSEKTVLRDIQTLIHEFNCPVAYDRTRKGYYLQHHNWDFVSHSLVAENEMMATVIGAKIAEDIFPDPIREKIRRAVDELLAHNNPEFLDTMQIESLKIFSEQFGDESPEIFMTVFNAWLTHNVLLIEYEDRAGTVSERKVEPHALVYFENAWGIKGYCHLRKQARTFLTSRMKSVKLLQEEFIPNKKIISSLTVDNFLSFPKEEDVKIRLLTESVKKFALKKKMHSKQKIVFDKNSNTYILNIPAVSKEVVVPWILSQKGEAIPLQPQCLINEVKNSAKNILKLI